MDKPFKGKYAKTVYAYARGVADGSIVAGEDRVLGCKRFLTMLEDPRFEIRTTDADFVIGIIESTFKHRQGELLDSTPLRGKPFLMEPWEKFCVYGMLIFFYPGTNERVVKEAFIFIPRKNGKTIFVSALSWALGLLQRLSGSKVYVVGAALKQAMTAAEKTELRYQYVLNATKQAQGDFAKTSGSLANQLRIASLQGQNAEAIFGNKLEPSVKRVISRFNQWMAGDYGKTLIAKTADETGKFAEGALTTLGNVLVWVLENTEAIKTGAESIGIGFLAAKVTGFVMSLTHAARVLMETSKGMGLLNAAMAANPAMVVGIAVAALTAGVIALAGSYQTLDDKLKALKLEVPQSSVDAVTDGINAGIAAADQTHEITVTINADTSALKAQLDGFLDADSDGGAALTKKEFKGISKYVKEVVQPDIDEAKKEMVQQKADFQASLLAITDDNGNSVFSKDRAAELADGLSVKTQGLIDELTGYKNDYIALAKEIYRDGRTPTEAEIENLNTLLTKIGEVRIQLTEAQDSATQVLKARMIVICTQLEDKIRIIMTLISTKI